MSVPDRRWLVWLVVFLAYAVFLVADALGDAFFGDLGCELVRGSSIYGDLSWSLPRLGSTCTYSIESYKYVERPSLLRPVILLGLALWAWTLRRSRVRQTAMA